MRLGSSEEIKWDLAINLDLHSSPAVITDSPYLPRERTLIRISGALRGAITILHPGSGESYVPLPITLIVPGEDVLYTYSYHATTRARVLTGLLYTRLRVAWMMFDTVAALVTEIPLNAVAIQRGSMISLFVHLSI